MKNIIYSAITIILLLSCSSFYVDAFCPSADDGMGRQFIPPEEDEPEEQPQEQPEPEPEPPPQPKPKQQIAPPEPQPQPQPKEQPEPEPKKNTEPTEEPTAPRPPPRPPAGNGIEPKIFNPVISVQMWENWWARNRLYYLPFKEVISWSEKSDDDQSGTVAVKIKPLNKMALETLIECLQKDKSPYVRAMSTLSLAKTKNKAVIKPLKEAMENDKNFDVKNTAALALGILGEESIVENLKSIMLGEGAKKAQMIPRAYAALALGYIKSQDSINALKEALTTNKKIHHEIKCSALLSLGNIGDPELISFIGKILLNNRNKDEIRIYAALALGRIQDISALKYLKRATKDMRSSVRASVAIALGLINSPKVKNDLVNLTLDKSSDVRAFATLALAKLGDKSTYKTVSKVANKADFMSEGVGVLALGILGDEKALPTLRKIAIKRTKPLCRSAAIISLALLKDKKSVPDLIKIIEKEGPSNPIDWSYTALALGILGDTKALPTLEKTFNKMQKRIDLAQSAYNNFTITLALLGKRKETLNILLKQINNKKTPLQIRARAINGIGYIGGKNAIEPLIKYYKTEKNAILRAETIFALGFILDREKINSLYKITADNNFNIKLLIMDHIFVSRPE